MARAPYVSPTVPDPGITRGRYRVLTTVTGVAIVYDPDRPLGKRTVAEAPNVKEATAIAERLAKADAGA